MTVKKIDVQKQGTIIIEPGEQHGFFMMFPNGDVCWQPSKQFAEAKAKQWFRENVGDAIGIGAIEWRK
ncbi:MAG TPA: hypothetical protein VGF90_06355 [Verrucomicrobiae bacterium]